MEKQTKTLTVIGKGVDGTLLNLSPSEGEKIKHLIHINTGTNFQLYARQKNLHPTNVYAYLSGGKPVSLRTLAKILPECLSLSMKVELTVHFGPGALGADYIETEKELLPTDTEVLEENNPYQEF